MPTEIQAKTMWCPYAKARDTKEVEAVAVNRTFEGNKDSSCRCLATACMAWRWAGSDQQPRRASVPSTSDFPWDEMNEPERPAELPASYTWSPPRLDAPGRWMEPEDEFKARRVRDRVGFCGIGGPID